MNDLSLRGVARRYAGVTNEISVVRDIFETSNITDTVSLRSKLESMAREQHSFDMLDCRYLYRRRVIGDDIYAYHFGWRAAFEQTWTHITVRIKLEKDDDVADATLNNLKTRWKNGIENIWNNEWGCGRSSELTCPLSFEVVWVTSGQHHTVNVRTDAGEAHDVENWHDEFTRNAAAHEFGHMLGLKDEYSLDECPDRDPVDTNTVMDCCGFLDFMIVPSRFMMRFADNIDSHVVSI